MRCTIEYRGVPLGHVTVAYSFGGRHVVPFAPLPAYAALRATPTADASAPGRALELRDAAGILVPTTSIELVEPLRAGEPIAAVVSLAEASMPAPALVPEPPRRERRAQGSPAT